MINLTDYPLLVFGLTFLVLWLSERIGSSLLKRHGNMAEGVRQDFGVILSAGYALWLYRKVVFGALVKPSLMSIKDLTLRECVILFPLVALTIFFGVYPKPVLDMSAASVQQLVNNYNTAVTAVKAAALLQ